MVMPKRLPSPSYSSSAIVETIYSIRKVQLLGAALGFLTISIIIIIVFSSSVCGRRAAADQRSIIIIGRTQVLPRILISLEFIPSSNSPLLIIKEFRCFLIEYVMIEWAQALRRREAGRLMNGRNGMHQHYPSARRRSRDSPFRGLKSKSLSGH